MARMPLERYAKQAGIEPALLRYHGRRGHFPREADGTVDPVEMQEWEAEYRARRGEAIETNTRAITARIAALTAKTQLARLQFVKLAKTMVNRVEAEAEATAEIETFMQHLRELDAAPILATGLDAEQASRLLAEFLALVLRDVGNPVVEVASEDYDAGQAA